MSTTPVMESIYFTYTEDSGSLSKLTHPRGSVFNVDGFYYQVVQATPEPRFLDYGQTPFQVRLKCRVTRKQKFWWNT